MNKYDQRPGLNGGRAEEPAGGSRMSTTAQIYQVPGRANPEQIEMKTLPETGGTVGGAA